MSRASAVPVMVDFTDSVWSGATDQTTHSQTYGLLAVTLSSTGGALTFNDGGPSSGSSELALHGDGIGIADDEVGTPSGEALVVEFSSAVTVLGYYLLDFFTGEGPGGVGELALVTLGGLDSDTMLLDIGTAADDVGLYSRAGLAAAGTTHVLFSTAGLSGLAAGYSDFALAGILVDVAPLPVPEPGTLGLLVLGLAALAVARPKRRVSLCVG